MGCLRGGEREEMENLLEEIGTPDIGVYRGAGNDCIAAGHLWEDIFRKEEERMKVYVEGIEPLFSIFVFQG